MNKLMVKKEHLNQYMINLAVLLAAWGGLYRRSFNSDTLSHMLSPVNDIYIQLQDGRYLTSLTDYILFKLGLSSTTHSGITVLFALFCLALGLCFVQNAFRAVIKQDTILEKAGFAAGTVLLFANVLFGENLMFVECAQAFGLGYLFASMGIYYFIKKKWAPAAVLLLFATTGYQVTVIYAAIVISAYIFIDNGCRITKKTVLQELLCGGFTFGAGLINMLSYTLLARLGISGGIRKAAGGGEVTDKLGEMARTYLAFLKSSKSLLPGLWLPLLMFLIPMAAILYGFMKKRDKKGSLYLVLLFLAMNAMVFVIPMVQTYVYLPPRIIWPLYAVQSALLLIASAVLKGRIKSLVCYVACGYLLIQLIFSNVIIANRTLSNSLDTMYANMVYEKILKYEEETGRTVTKLAVRNDTDCPFSYEEVHYKTDQINERALGTVTNTLVNVVTGRDFEKVEMEEEIYQTCFGNKNWDYFDASEQLVIQGDTAYWVIF